MHEKDIRWAGKKPEEATQGLILVHGRGATAEDILSLANVLNTEGFSIAAPQATRHSWYPYKPRFCKGLMASAVLEVLRRRW